MSSYQDLTNEQVMDALAGQMKEREAAAKKAKQDAEAARFYADSATASSNALLSLDEKIAEVREELYARHELLDNVLLKDRIHNYNYAEGSFQA
jgi:hypothetical protein